MKPYLPISAPGQEPWNKNAVETALAPDMKAMLHEAMLAGPALVICDAHGNKIFSSPSYESYIAGAKQSGQAPSLADIVARLEDSAEPFEHSLSLQKDDRISYYNVEHRAQFSAEGYLVGFLSLYWDISSEVRMRDRLLLMQSRFEDITRISSDWIWETDASLSFTLLSPRVLDVLGRHPRELLTKHFLEVSTLFDDGIWTIEKLQETLERYAPFRHVRFIMQDRDQKEKLLRMSGMPVFDEQGAFKGYRGIAQDITQEVEARERARLLEQRLTYAIESLNDGFALYDSRQHLVLRNKKLQQFFPQVRDELLPGAHLEEFLHQAIAVGDIVLNGVPADSWLESRIARWRAGGGPFEFQLADGSWLMAHDYKTADQTTVTLLTDITALKQREESLQHAKNEAETASKTRTEFFAKMSHELRTPLNAVIGFSDILKNEGFGPLGSPQYKEYAQDIHESAHHLLNIINDILDMSKVEAGKLELYEQAVSVVSTVQSSLRMVKPKADETGVELVSDEVDGNLVIRADAKKLKQILLNLLTNSVKFTDRGGKVSVFAHIDNDGHPCIGVRDTGIGMTPEGIQKALTPFGQVDSSLSRKYEGTGLGLPLTQALIELHDGEMLIESEPKKGTTVTARFPRERIVEIKK
ncbi:MAG: PAS domain-containing sensor histidine kinase [Dongiaceae bacterium]